MSTPEFPPQPGSGPEQTPPASSVPPGTPPYTPYGGDPNRAPGSGSDRFFDSIRRTGLARSEDRWVGGVAGGLAERLGWDPLLVRGLLFLSFFLTGIGLVAYAVGWALLPERRDGRIHLQQAGRGDFDIALLGAAVALLAGLSNADGVGWWRGGWGGWGWIISLFWIAVWVTLAWLLVRYLRDRRQNRPAPGPTYPTGPGYPTQSGTDAASFAAPSTSPAEGVSSPVPPTTPMRPTTPAASFTAPVLPVPPAPYGDPRAQAAQAKAEASRAAAQAKADAARIRAQAAREEAQARSFEAKQRAEARAAERASRPVTKSAGAGTVGVVFGLMLVAGALLAAADRGGFRFPAPFDGTYDAALLWVGASLVIIGAAIVISGVRGRSSGWLGFLAIVGLVVALPWSVTVGDADLRDIRITRGFESWTGVGNGIDVSEGTVAPRSVAEAERGFRAQFGDPTIDLSGLDLSAATGDDPVEVPIQLTAGDLTVVVPRDVAVEAEVRLLAGQVVWRVDDGERTINRVGGSTVHLRSDQATDGDAVLRLLVSAGAGNVTVEED
ncbi:phage shock protein C, PspC [Xylanimonas cellulosilytica DSM 15894]|uniref:Phage shock protein C, PspC n=1 Tax=Xylanimonas cellulosilytica (strain DSM 15894 / JCM 12276 / CECT 5975 / KCTC 9989 / LMG 20990 / NBRC 107835 / XIL07) TaxID=446471 RepID=D1BXD7_XYLCX|nr:PspC domain-containing protein [Xylanimonas cellulosilytica]ACZ29747.1 phage shock protein C, PspC [Xylanimonas cellulosilytica DSM 15894]